MTAPHNVLARCSLLAASLFALCTAQAPAADLVRVGKASATTFAFAPIDIGKEKGIWAKYNLDVESIGFGGDARLQHCFAKREPLCFDMTGTANTQPGKYGRPAGHISAN